MEEESNENKYSIVNHTAQRSLVISSSVLQSNIPSLGKHIDKLQAYLNSNTSKYHAVGPPFFRYRRIPVDMAQSKSMTIDVGIPISSSDENINTQETVITDGIILTVLPAGPYLTTLHIGAPEGLRPATAAMLKHAAKEGLELDREEQADEKGNMTVWKCRLEVYESDPVTEPDMSQWRTRLEFLLKEK